jgi:hypothetical protein
MRDGGLYERILGLPEPRHILDVDVRDDAREVVVEMAMGAPISPATRPPAGTPPPSRSTPSAPARSA